VVPVVVLCCCARHGEVLPGGLVRGGKLGGAHGLINPLAHAVECEEAQRRPEARQHILEVHRPQHRVPPPALLRTPEGTRRRSTRSGREGGVGRRLWSAGHQRLARHLWWDHKIVQIIRRL